MYGGGRREREMLAGRRYPLEGASDCLGIQDRRDRMRALLCNCRIASWRLILRSSPHGCAGRPPKAEQVAARPATGCGRRGYGCGVEARAHATEHRGEEPV